MRGCGCRRSRGRKRRERWPIPGWGRRGSIAGCLAGRRAGGDHGRAVEMFSSRSPRTRRSPRLPRSRSAAACSSEIASSPSTPRRRRTRAHARTLSSRMRCVRSSAPTLERDVAGADPWGVAWRVKRDTLEVRSAVIGGALGVTQRRAAGRLRAIEEEARVEADEALVAEFLGEGATPLTGVVQVDGRFEAAREADRRLHTPHGRGGAFGGQRSAGRCAVAGPDADRGEAPRVGAAPLVMYAQREAEPLRVQEGRGEAGAAFWAAVVGGAAHHIAQAVG